MSNAARSSSSDICPSLSVSTSIVIARNFSGTIQNLLFSFNKKSDKTTNAAVNRI